MPADTRPETASANTPPSSGSPPVNRDAVVTVDRLPPEGIGGEPGPAVVLLLHSLPEAEIPELRTALARHLTLAARDWRKSLHASSSYSEAETEASDPAQQSMLRDIDAILGRLEKGISGERTAMDALLDRLTSAAGVDQRKAAENAGDEALARRLRRLDPEAMLTLLRSVVVEEAGGS
jgi:hypothetical protein